MSKVSRNFCRMFQLVECEILVKARGPTIDRVFVSNQTPFDYLKLLFETESFLFFWINLEIHDLLSLCLPQLNPFASHFVGSHTCAFCASCFSQALLHKPSTYLHVVFALYQVRQSVKPAHGQHKQRQTNCQESARALGHVNAACALSLNWAALTEQSAILGRIVHPPSARAFAYILTSSD